MAFQYKSKAQTSGFIEVSDKLYFEMTEVDVASWLSFYSWVLENKGYHAAQKILPDSIAIEPEVWDFLNVKSEIYDDRITTTGKPIGFFKKDCSIPEKYKKRLYKVQGSCDFVSFPITGITYEQAVAFCEWRTKVQGNNKIVYRLPTNKEWIEFSTFKFSESEKNAGQRDSLYKNKCPMFNYFSLKSCEDYPFQGSLNGIAMFPREKSGAFDIFGNISEMTSIKGIAKGGNFTLFASQCHPDSIQSYSRPELWLGFRCVAEKVDISKNQLVQYKGNVIDTIKPIDDNFGEFEDKRDGKKYRTIKIGEQVWLAENLAFKPDSGKYWPPENNKGNIERYGYLYNWETAKNVCPSGWRLPEKNDFELLLQNYGKNAYKELKVSGSSGFSIIDCGLKYGVNYTTSEGGTVFWTSTEKNKRNVWGLSVDSRNSIIKFYDTFGKNSGLPIRCIKDK